MPKSFPRNRRVGEQIQRSLSELIRREVKDPRLGPVTLTHVEVATDLAYAKVFYTVLGGARDPKVAQGILNSAAGFLRGPLGRSLGLRHSPELRFVADDLIEKGAKLHALITAAVRNDDARHVDDAADTPPRDNASDDTAEQ